jgi:hypothetical protein
MRLRHLLTANDDEDDGLGLVVGACIVGTSAGLSIVGLSIVGLYYLGSWLFAEPGRPGAVLVVMAGFGLIVAALRRAL